VQGKQRPWRATFLPAARPVDGAAERRGDQPGQGRPRRAVARRGAAHGLRVAGDGDSGRAGERRLGARLVAVAAMARHRADSAGERLGRARGEAAEFRGEANRLWGVETGRKARGGRRDVDGAQLGSARLELKEGEEERRKGNVASGRG